MERNGGHTYGADRTLTSWRPTRGQSEFEAVVAVQATVAAALDVGGDAVAGGGLLAVPAGEVGVAGHKLRSLKLGRAGGVAAGGEVPARVIALSR
jgi:hypothetical protein